jgi:putative transposase
MVYIDLNMVRAGVVVHPSEWPFCGYNEIQNPRERYSLIDQSSLIELFNMGSMDKLRRTYGDWVEEALEKQGRERQPQWTESIAIGAEAFVRDTKEKLGIRAAGLEVIGTNGSYELREPETPYEADFGHENAGLRQENGYFGDVSL